MFGGKTVHNDLRRFYLTLFRQAEFWKIGVIEPPIQVFLKPPLRGAAISTAPPSTLSATGSAPAHYGIA